MLTQSDILLGYSRIWELLRGVYNRKFDEISKKKVYKNVIEHLWGFCYDKYRTRIWVKRCDEVAEIEKDREKLVKLVTRNNLLDDVTNGRSFKNNWERRLKYCILHFI
ncbi:hypothetical protein RhiirB3_450104 [Rhizophagus irregularis]|nr:hypothetical protein RhiirB3_450104 [Rhizophagus irregularis]